MQEMRQLAPGGNVVGKIKQVRTSTSKRCGGRNMCSVDQALPPVHMYTTCMYVRIAPLDQEQ